ncbi:TPA: hypothetical protein ACXNP2_003298 [Stenotrophomonas maltophilia]
MNTATTDEVNQWGQMAGNTLDASVDNGEDGGWFFRLAPHGATHP